MRTEQEMFQLILGVAQRDERIRAVYMNGSRTNPKVKRDIFQDYDIVYVVTETQSFIEDEGWIKVFGEPLIIQEPDKLDRMLGHVIDFSKRYAYLMQFVDGNRIDLTLRPLENLDAVYSEDKLTLLLLDKGSYLPSIGEPSDEDYWVKKPTQEAYFGCCNEFWWVAPYCAKGLWRNEILFMVEMMNDCVRQELMKMLGWSVGIENEFKVSIGKANKYLSEYVDETTWKRLMKTFNMGEYQSAWEALLVACELFEEVALKVGEELGYVYNREEARRSFEFIKHIRDLPKEAKEIY